MHQVPFDPQGVRARAIAPDAACQASLDEALFREGLLQVKPASFYKPWRQDDLSAFCVRHGVYCLPTEELVDWLREKIGPRTAIEIGCGNGAIGRALGIPRTDSKQQERSDIQELYRSMGQAPATYPDDVEKLTALEAAEKYRPQVIVASWVTHRFDEKEAFRGGNQWGIDEEKLIAKKFVKSYIHIGHEDVHKHKKIRGQHHRIYRMECLYSRSMTPLGNVIWEWVRWD